MKKYIIYLSALLISINSCESALDFEIKDQLTLENYYQSETDALSSIYAVYDALGDVDLYASSFWLLQDIASDDCDALNTWNDPNAHQIDRYNIKTTNNYITNIWRASYQLIARANLSTYYIPNINMDEELKNSLVGEAKFLRALGYFNMTRLFGSVPLVLFPESDIDKYLVSQSSIDSIYEQIINDLSFAAEHLPISYDGNNKGRATKGAALGQLAKVYLTLQNWEDAATTAKQVMDLADEGVYGLWDDFASNFKEVNKNGLESIFEVQFYSAIQEENTRIVISGLPSIYAFPAGVGIILPTEDLLSQFEPGDYRYETTFFEEYFFFGNNTFDPHIWKHWDQNTYPADETGQSGANFPVMRYAEVLLIYAEALNEQHQGPTSEAYAAANEVRIRARNGNDTVLPELNGLTYEEFQAAVWKEKRCETVNEGHRWFDLVRTNRLVEKITIAKDDKANPQAHNYVFPIPQRERDLNENLGQNDNY